MAKLYGIKTDYVDAKYQEKLEKFKEAFYEYFQSYNAIRIRKENYKYIDFMDNNAIVIEMIDRTVKDFGFRQQVSHAKTETKEFINAIIKTFELVELKQAPATAEDFAERLHESPERATIHSERSGATAAELQGAFKANLKNMIGNQKLRLLNAEDSKYKTKMGNMDLY